MQQLTCKRLGATVTDLVNDIDHPNVSEAILKAFINNIDPIFWDLTFLPHIGLELTILSISLLRGSKRGSDVDDRQFSCRLLDALRLLLGC
jgi:hypothetical protein